MNINQGYFMPRAFSSTYFPYAYINILDNYNTITRDTRLLSLNWNHTLSNRSFYQFTIGKFFTREHSAVQDAMWNEYEERLDIEPINYSMDNTNMDGNIYITYGDEFYDHGFAVDLMRKDLEIVINESKKNNVQIEVTERINKFYKDLQDQGGGRWDTSSLLKRIK